MENVLISKGISTSSRSPGLYMRSQRWRIVVISCNSGIVVVAVIIINIGRDGACLVVFTSPERISRNCER